jgi:hypothetical protein
MTSRITTQAGDQKILEGIATSLPKGPLYLGSKTYTPTSLSAFVQRRIDLANSVEKAKAAWLEAIRSYKTHHAETRVVVDDLRHLVIGAYGVTSPKLADFGFAPPKRYTLTQEQKALAVERRNATRKARKTMGSRQKKAITGEVPEPPTELP